MKHDVKSFLKAERVNPAKAFDLLADHIVQSPMQFDMADADVCAMAHAKAIGLLPEARDKDTDHKRGCGCTNCCDYRKGARNMGVRPAILEGIFNMVLVDGDSTRKQAAAQLRKIGKQVEKHHRIYA